MPATERVWFDERERWIMRRTIEISAQRGPMLVLGAEYRACRDEAERDYEQAKTQGEAA